jgi:Protein of unknown function (DUF1439)
MTWFKRMHGLSVGALSAALLAACNVSGDGITYNITASQFQEKIAPRFPVEDCRLLLACVNLNSPKVILNEGSDRIAFQVQLAFKAGNKITPGVVTASSKLRYDKESISLFLEDVQIDQLQIDGLSNRSADLVRTLTPALVGNSLTNKPIYTFKSDSGSNQWLNARIQNVKVVDGKLQVLVGWSRQP